MLMHSLSVLSKAYDSTIGSWKPKLEDNVTKIDNDTWLYKYKLIIDESVVISDLVIKITISEDITEEEITPDNFSFRISDNGNLGQRVMEVLGEQSISFTSKRKPALGVVYANNKDNFFSGFVGTPGKKSF